MKDATQSAPANRQPVLITGGCGFIGANLAHRLLSGGQPVVLYDNLSRPGVEENHRWLAREHGGLLRLQVADTRDAETLAEAVARASAVFHFAAQVAVTTSLESPVGDFEVNARGTLNVLEALRVLANPPPLIFTSTNKVYGSLPGMKLSRTASRCEPADPFVAARGICESQRLDFYSPYGCSKGAADQYVLEYARTYGLPALVFRMSCIYGPHQFGTEDQGWVAHFLIQALAGRPITLYGDGRQVRDLLYVDDLIDALLIASRRAGALRGQAFNIGGGVQNTLSLLELLELTAELTGGAPRIEWGSWRPGDQHFYVSDTTRFFQQTGWQPKVAVREGIGRLHQWLRQRAEARPLAST